MANKIKDRAALGAAIKARRKEQGLTLRDIATQLGVPHPRIAEVESGAMAGLDYYIACTNILGGDIRIEWKKPREIPGAMISNP